MKLDGVEIKKVQFNYPQSAKPVRYDMWLEQKESKATFGLIEMTREEATALRDLLSARLASDPVKTITVFDKE